MTMPHQKPDINDISKLLFDTAAEGLLITDSRGQIVRVNPRSLEMFGYNPGELVGEGINVLIPKDKRKIHGEKVGLYNSSPKRRVMGRGLDLMGLRKDGSKFPVEISLNHFKDFDKVYVMALISDISERKEAEMALVKLNEELEQRVEDRTRQLRESQHLYSLMARSFPNGTINVFDRNFDYVFTEGMEMYKLGISGDKLVGTNYMKRIPAELRNVIKTNFERAFAGEEVNFELSTGNSQYLLSAIGLPDDKGNLEQILVVEQNITKQKQAEDKVRAALEREKELNELKSRFVSMASHEFRTPLSTVLSSATLIERYNDEPKKERISKHVGKIKSSVRHLTGILNDFLSLDKLEQGKITTRFESFNLKELCDDLVEDLVDLINTKQKIITEYKGEQIICQDQNIIKNILTNLLSNAIKYSPELKPIKLSVKNKEELLKFCVEDQGIGIPWDDQKNLFERFFRAKNATNIGGTGLGLNIVKKYVGMLKGTITFESSPESGTCFEVQIPHIRE